MMGRAGTVALTGVAWITVGLTACTADDDPAPRFAARVIDAAFPAISVTPVDVDGDGKLDVVAAGGASGGRSVWSSQVVWYRAPSWERKPVCALEDVSIILHVEAADFTRKSGESGRKPAEIAITDGERGRIWWYRYDRDRHTWKGDVIVDDVRYAHGTANGDVDGDGYADLLVPTQHGTPRQGMIWARNPGRSGHPWLKCPLAATFGIGGWQHYVRLADLNGDGKLDALHGSDDAKSGWFGFWLQGKDSRGEWEAHALSGPMKHGTNLEAGDFNGDGRLDLVGSEGHGKGLWWFPAPDFPAQRVDDTLESAHAITVADWNRDGHTDLASCGYGSRIVAAFMNDGKGSFRRHVLDTNQCAYDACAVDLDADGDQDILLAGQNSSNVVWYSNLSVEGGNAR